MVRVGVPVVEEAGGYDWAVAVRDERTGKVEFAEVSRLLRFRPKFTRDPERFLGLKFAPPPRFHRKGSYEMGCNQGGSGEDGEPRGVQEGRPSLPPLRLRNGQEEEANPASGSARESRLRSTILFPMSEPVESRMIGGFDEDLAAGPELGFARKRRTRRG